MTYDQPTPVSDLQMAFPGSLGDLLPPEQQIPSEFWDGQTPWNQLTSRWFFHGLKGTFVPKPGIDLELALRHIKTILGSFEPQHEHKEAAVAYLMSLWFEKFVPTPERETLAEQADPADPA